MHKLKQAKLKSGLRVLCILARKKTHQAYSTAPQPAQSKAVQHRHASNMIKNNFTQSN